MRQVQLQLQSGEVAPEIALQVKLVADAILFQRQHKKHNLIDRRNWLIERILYDAKMGPDLADAKLPADQKTLKESYEAGRRKRQETQDAGAEQLTAQFRVAANSILGEMMESLATFDGNNAATRSLQAAYDKWRSISPPYGVSYPTGWVKAGRDAASLLPKPALDSAQSDQSVLGRHWYNALSLCRQVCPELESRFSVRHRDVLDAIKRQQLTTAQSGYSKTAVAILFFVLTESETLRPESEKGYVSWGSIPRDERDKFRRDTYEHFISWRKTRSPSPGQT